MFTKELSNNILKLLEEKGMTFENLADTAHLTRKFVGNIINQKQTPTLHSFEKICSALEVTPDSLLLSDKSKLPDKSSAMQVTKVYCLEKPYGYEYFSVCPSCNKTLEREYQAYCDRCGQKLSWKNFSKAEIISKLPNRD